MGELFKWCESMGTTAMSGVQPLHASSLIELQSHQVYVRSIKQNLTAIRHLFDGLVTG